MIYYNTLPILLVNFWLEFAAPEGMHEVDKIGAQKFHSSHP
jgi:hypothetical protein